MDAIGLAATARAVVGWERRSEFWLEFRILLPSQSVRVRWLRLRLGLGRRGQGAYSSPSMGPAAVVILQAVVTTRRRRLILGYVRHYTNNGWIARYSPEPQMILPLPRQHRLVEV